MKTLFFINFYFKITCRVLILTTGVILFGCGDSDRSTNPADDSTQNIPIPASRELRDLSYGPDPLQKMDVFFPLQNKPTQGIVIVIHGGGWIVGDKKEVHYLAKHLAQKGYLTVSPNYRLSPFPGGPTYSKHMTITEMLDDIDAVKSFANHQKDNWNCDASKISMVGFSAGAHLALLQSFTRNHSGAIRSCTSFAAPTDLTDSALLSNPIGLFKGIDLINFSLNMEYDSNKPALVEKAKKFSPLYQIKNTAVKFLLVHGTSDSTVPYAQGVRFRLGLNNQSIGVDFFEATGQGHDLSGVMASVVTDKLLPLLASTL